MFLKDTLFSVACVPKDWDPSDAEAWNKVTGLLVKTRPPLWMLLSFTWMISHGYEELQRGNNLGSMKEIKLKNPPAWSPGLEREMGCCWGHAWSQVAEEAGWWWEVRMINPSVYPNSKPVTSLLQLGYEYANFWKNKLESNGVSTELLRIGKGSQEQSRNERKCTHRSVLRTTVVRGDGSIVLESLSAMHQDSLRRGVQGLSRISPVRWWRWCFYRPNVGNTVLITLKQIDN